MIRKFIPTNLASLSQAFEWLEEGDNVCLVQSHDTEIYTDSDISPAVGVYSSGSTGRPKLVWRPWRQMASELRVAPEMAHWVWASPYSSVSFAGAQVAAQAWRNRNAAISLGYGWDVDWNLLLSHNVHALSCTPTYMDLLLQFSGKDVSAWRPQQITLGGEVLRPAAGERFRKAFPQTCFSVIFASAEHGVLLKTHRLDGWYESTVLSARYPQWRVANGELQLWKDDDWRSTGDLIEVNDSLIRVLGRVDRVANIAGTKVSLDEVSSLAEQVIGVRSAVAFAEPNPISGQIVCLRFTLDAGFSEEEVQQRLQKHLRESLRKEAWPRRWESGPIEIGSNSKRTFR